MRVIPHNDDLESLVEYYEALLDYLDDVIPNLEYVIDQFDETWENKE